MMYHLERTDGHPVSFKPTENRAAATAEADRLRAEALEAYTAQGKAAQCPHYHVIATTTVYVTSTLADILGTSGKDQAAARGQ